jgi:DDE superfamily endonuclease
VLDSAIALSDIGWTNNKLGIQWLLHFDKHTKGRTVGTRRLLILDGHKSHNSLQFQELCKEKGIITLCMPAHSLHLLQPLDVGCFSPLKAAYSRQLENLIRSSINHITKIEFLLAFKAAY